MVSPGRVAGESGVRAVAFAGPKVRLVDDGDSGPGYVRCFGLFTYESYTPNWARRACRATEVMFKRGPPPGSQCADDL